MKQAEVVMRNIFTAFIDYKEALDAIPPTQLQEMLYIYKAHPSRLLYS
jgi:hypothetical protein